MGTGRNGIVMFWEMGFDFLVTTVQLGNTHFMRLRLLNVILDNNNNRAITLIKSLIRLIIPIRVQSCDVTSADSQIIKKIGTTFPSQVPSHGYIRLRATRNQPHH
jgi:hypothetical protein